VAQGSSFDDVVFDIEIAAIHIHPFLAETGEEGRLVGRMGKDGAVADRKRKSIVGLFEMHDLTF